MNTPTFELYSDLYKDVNGSRPSMNAMYQFNSLSHVEKQAEWDRLVAKLASNEAERAIDDKNAVDAFEQRIAETIKAGAGDRITAIRWILDSLGDSTVYQDVEYGCYLLNIPYGTLDEMLPHLQQ